jgi:hypothetical protein
MKTSRKNNETRWRRRSRGFLEIDMMVGMAILVLAVMPVAYSIVRERHVLKLEYCRSVADEIVDGEMEILAAGAARNLPDGSQNYIVHAAAAAKLPPGHFQLTKTGSHLRLAWMPDTPCGVGPVVRETTFK